MKKTLIALAALASTAAFAQNVTLSGTMDFGLERTASGQQLQASNSRNGTTQITWAGSEDLGGGLKGNFKVSTAFDATFAAAGAVAAPANQIFGNNDMFVGVSGGFGDIKLGRSFNPVFINNLTANGTKGVTGYNSQGATLDNVGVYVSNQVLYTTPSMAGLTASVSWAPKEAGAGKNHTGFALAYSAGPIAARLAVANATNGSGGGITAKNFMLLAAAYDLGVARVLFTMQDDGNNASNQDTAYVLGATVPMGAGTLWAQYGVAETPGTDARIISAGYKHALSKRTTAYVSLGNRNTAAAGFNAAQAKATGYGMGLQHNF